MIDDLTPVITPPIALQHDLVADIRLRNVPWIEPRWGEPERRPRAECPADVAVPVYRTGEWSSPLFGDPRPSSQLRQHLFDSSPTAGPSSRVVRRQRDERLEHLTQAYGRVVVLEQVGIVGIE